MKHLLFKNGNLHSIIAIDNFEFDTEIYDLIETNLVPIFIRNKWNGNKWIDITTPEDIKIEVPQEISRAAFMYGLDLQGVVEKEGEALYFIENFISDIDMQRKARNLFTSAGDFEHFNELLQNFFPAFNQFLVQKGKEAIIYDDIFINGKKLNE